MTTAHRIETVVGEDGQLLLNSLPFRAGQAVEVIILAVPGPSSAAPLSLQGTVLRYDDPTAPVAEGDWGAPM